MILVTGATGNIGSALLRHLRTSGAAPLRGLTRRPASATLPPGVHTVAGDLTRPASLAPALNGVRALFLVPGPGPVDEVLTAARRAGVRHIVLVSSLTVETHPRLPAAAEKLAAEQALRRSGMTWTILRPTQFASNTLWWATSIRREGTVQAPYPDTGLPAIHPADIAAVAHSALTTPGHHGRTYALTGPARVTPRQQVAALSEALGRPLTLVAVSRERAHRQLAAFMGERDADAVLDLTGGDVNEGLLRVRDTVSRVTGSPARTFRQWAREHADAFR